MGFEFVIRQSSDKVEAAAGLFTAYSLYRPQETANERSQTRVAQRFASESKEQFRAAQTGTVDGFINMIFCALHSPVLRAWRFDLPGDKDATSKLAEAFQIIRDVLQQGEVVPNPKLQAHLQVAAARNNTALQTLLGSMQAQSSSSPGLNAG